LLITTYLLPNSSRNESSASKEGEYIRIQAITNQNGMSRVSDTNRTKKQRDKTC
jgi:hypothetical protein